jgi:hypothetical protein
MVSGMLTGRNSERSSSGMQHEFHHGKKDAYQGEHPLRELCGLMV